MFHFTCLYLTLTTAKCRFFLKMSGITSRSTHAVALTQFKAFHTTFLPSRDLALTS